MKKYFWITILFAFIGLPNFAQINDGTYTYSDNEIKLVFSIAENGQTISKVTLTDLKTYQNETGTGTVTKIDGIGTYTFKTDKSSYSFETPDDELKMKQVSGTVTRIYILNKEPLIGWNGTYRNSKGALLIIGNYKDGVGFDYRLTYKGETSCGSVSLAGMTKLLSKTNAYEGEYKDFPDVKFELKENSINCVPSPDMLGTCSTLSFDSEFVRSM